ncbi:MAG: hybrid sensor histidine kinase/response regulator [Microcoleaceae cyanobacterium]|jgi:signal transduction histidine kinase
MSQIRILIVEDELLIAKGVSRKLEKLGYQVVNIVSSGESAIASATELKPDLILMDIVIKGDMDGIETAAKINKILNIPVVFTTAYDDEETLKRAEKTGSYGYILKPIKDRDLNATIKMALSKHQQQLEMQKNLAEIEAINEAKNRYLSIASHDLRTPLTAIQMSTSILQDYEEKLTTEKKLQHYSRIKSAVNNMNQLLEDILTLSQVESGKLILNPVPLDIIELSRNILDDLADLANKKQSLELVSLVDSFTANFDEKLLRYCLMNLLSNAIKYSPEGGKIILEIKVQPENIIFRIQDQGIGIPEKDKAKLFQEFQRASNVGNIKGTGLGLSIVKQMIDLYGGKISVESEVGKGTTFMVTLPLNV